MYVRMYVLTSDVVDLIRSVSIIVYHSEYGQCQAGSQISRVADIDDTQC